MKSQNKTKKPKKSLKHIYIYIYLKYVILLVLPFEEISFQPDLFKPARFRILGGSPEREIHSKGVLVAGLYFPFLILDLYAPF